MKIKSLIFFVLMVLGLNAQAQALYFTPYPFYWGAHGNLSPQSPSEDFEAAMSVAFTNTLRYNLSQIFDDQMMVDYDATTLTLGFQSPHFDWGQVSLDGIFASSYGGVLDAFIEGWHSAFALPNQGRELFEQNLNRLIYIKDGKTYVYEVNQNFFSPELQTYYRSPWIKWDSWGLQGMAGLKLGQDGPLPFDGALALGAGAAVDWEWEALYLSLTAGLWYRTPPQEPWTDFYVPVSGQGEFQASYFLLPWLKAFTQFSFTTAPFSIDNYWLSGGSGFFTLGGDFLLGEDWELGVSLWQEFFTWATMEMALQATVRWKL